jgi:hypothetical protein
MKLLRRYAVAMATAVLFFNAEVAIAIALGCVAVRSCKRAFDINVAMREGIRFGVYMAAVIAVLAFSDSPGRRLPR